MKLSPHFSTIEAACRCGREDCPFTAERIELDRGLLTTAKITAAMLQKVRLFLGGETIHVNSWFRCPEHNEAVGGADGSLHLRGWAVDFTHRKMSARAVQGLLRTAEGRAIARGLGRYRSFTHVDRRADPATWTG